MKRATVMLVVTKNHYEPEQSIIDPVNFLLIIQNPTHIIICGITYLFIEIITLFVFL